MKWPWEKKKMTIEYNYDLEDLSKCLKHFKSFMNQDITIYDLKNDVVLIYGKKRFPLPPCGARRVGNILALALELRLWFIATLLIECEEVDIETISYLADGSNPVSANEYISDLKNYYDIYDKADIYDKMLEKIAIRREKECVKTKANQR